jgi:hypothetical protein
LIVCITNKIYKTRIYCGFFYTASLASLPRAVFCDVAIQKKLAKVLKFQIKTKDWIATPYKSKKRGARN